MGWGNSLIKSAESSFGHRPSHHKVCLNSTNRQLTASLLIKHPEVMRCY